MASISSVQNLLEPYINRFVNSEENTTVELAKKMKQIIDEQASSTASQVDYLSLVNRFVTIGQDLVSPDGKDGNYRQKLAGLAMLATLLELNDESACARRIEICSNLRKLFENEKLSLDSNERIFRTAAQLVGILGRISTTTEIEFLQNIILPLAFKLLTSARSDNHRLCGALILTQLTVNAPALIFTKRKDLFLKIWDAVGDKNSRVRVAAGETLEASLRLVSQREDMSGYLEQGLKAIEMGLARNASTERVIGSLLVLSIFVGGEVVNLDKLREAIGLFGVEVNDILEKVLERKDVRDFELRLKVVNLLPRLVHAFQNQFTSIMRRGNQRYLDYTVKFLFECIKSKKDRPICFIALGKMFMASTVLRSSSLVNDTIAIIREGFNDPFCVQALDCLSMLVNVSSMSRHLVTIELIDAMFRGGLTQELVDTLRVLLKHVLFLRPNIQRLLRLHITSVLQRFAVIVDDLSFHPVTGIPGGNIGGNAGANGGAANSTPSLGPGGLPPRVLAIAGSPQGLVLEGLQTNQTGGKTPATRQNVWGGSFFSSPTQESTQGSNEMNPDGQIQLALKVLSSHEFFPKKIRDAVALTKSEEDQTINLVFVVRDAVIRYLDDLNPDIRCAAALTCLAVLDTVILSLQPASEEFGIVFSVIDRLLLVSVGDDNERIRCTVLSAFQPSLDEVVAQSENVDCLVESLNDESVNVRAASMSVLSRVAHYDSLHVMPVVRLTLKRLIQQLEYSQDYQLRQESVKLLQAMVQGANTLIVPYVSQMLAPLMSLLDDPTPAVVGAALSTIGELALASPENIRQHIDILFGRLIVALNDNSCLGNQEIAVVAIGKLVSSLALLTDEPYVKYPGLFEGLVKAIQSTEADRAQLRLQALRTVGLLGIVEPSLFQERLRLSSGGVDTISGSQDHVDDDVKLAAAGSESNEDEKKLSKVERYCFVVVMRTLLNIILDSSLATHHQSALLTAVKIIRYAGAQSYPMINDLIKGVISRARHPETTISIRELCLESLSSIINIVGRQMKKYQDVLIVQICDMLDSSLVQCLDIFESMFVVFPVPDFNVVLRGVLPAFLQIVRSELSPASFNGLSSPESLSSKGSFPRKLSLPKTFKILQTIANISDRIGEFRRPVLHIVVTVLDSNQVTPETRKLALCTAYHLAGNGDLAELANRLIHPLLRVLSSSTPADAVLIQASIICLSCLVCRMGVEYFPFIIPVRRCIRSMPARDALKLPQLDEYESLVQRLLKQRPLPVEPTESYDISVSVTLKSKTSRAANEGPYLINMQALETAWALANRDSATDLTDWMGRLSVELIRQSPCPIIRMCAAMTKTYKPMAEQLLKASFWCIWDELYAGDTLDVVDNIPLINGFEMALNSSQIPGALVNSLLNLVEFMDMQDKKLPIDAQLLGLQAATANMFAKCLRYRETEFNSANIRPTSHCVEALITVNNELGLQDRATGVLNYVMSHYAHIQIQPLWLEKLHHWGQARQAYLVQNVHFRQTYPFQRPPKHHNWMASELGALRCLHALGEYEELANAALVLRDHIKASDQDSSMQGWMTAVQTMGADAAWMLGRWETMDQIIDSDNVTRDSNEEMHDVELGNNVLFYRGILAIHQNKLEQARSIILETRQQLSNAVSTLLSENYNRAYRAMVSMQILAEMEEVVEFKQFVSLETNEKTERSGSIYGQIEDVGVAMDSGVGSWKRNKAIDTAREVLLKKWRGRLGCVPKEVDIFRQILTVRSLAVSPVEDMCSWLELITLCRKENMFSMCGNILKLLGAPPLPTIMVPPTSSPANPESPSFSGRPSLVRASSLSPSDDQFKHADWYRTTSSNCRVIYAAYKFWWAVGERVNALHALSEFLTAIKTPMGALSDGTVITYPASFNGTTFRVRCLLKRAEWMRELGDRPFEEVLATVQEARSLADTHFSVWHAWAVTHFNQLQKVDAESQKSLEKNMSAAAEVANLLTSSENGRSVHSPSFLSSPRPLSRSSVSGGSIALSNLFSAQYETDVVTSYVVEAIKGFIRSIVLGKGQPVANILQDTLRLLTLWFSYGTRQQVFEILSMDLNQVAPENWLMVVPQLIARMHIKAPEISGLLNRLLVKLAGTHPQALVCPIYVAYNTSDEHQKRMAAEVAQEMRKHNAELVDEATMVSREMMRVAMTPHEIWHDGLETAAQQYIEFKDVRAMMTTLTGLHEAMNDAVVSAPTEGFSEDVGKVSHSTLRDISFRHSYGRQLSDAQSWLNLFRDSGRTTHLHQAWEVYQQVFKRIKAQIQALKKVELHHVSPELTCATNLTLAVPGTYSPFKKVISIQNFSASVDVISSKQRPRKMSINGCDGKNYPFLLKGHEDLRQDERVMQLFGLINLTFDTSRVTKNLNLGIVRYSVLPLSNNSGVIGWVENCDTLNQLIKQYRELKNIRLNVETKLLSQKCPTYLKLPLINKVEVFTQVIEETTGQDLAKMLWLKSKTADAWVERRAQFTKSMAVMSMVGYILGLGDRHPSNLMLDRVSGRIVHIDFGDCFEVTTKRAKFPETVPFRLTRMLVNAIEKCGLEGTFRITCERVMRVLRDNRDSVMAMLEAFVYDPLISWRLLGDQEKTEPRWELGVGGATAATQGVLSPVDKVLSPRSSREAPDSSPRYSGIIHGEETNANKAEEDHAASSPPIHVTAQPPPVVSAAKLELRREISAQSEEPEIREENINARALEVISRIQAKLTGRDFAKVETEEDLTVEAQVDRLIHEATSVENLCQLFQGWCPMW